MLRASCCHSRARLASGRLLAFAGRASNPLDHYGRVQLTWSSPSPVLLTLSALQHETQRRRGPFTPKAGFRFAGWALTARASNPLDRYERFQIAWSSSFPVLLTLDKLPSIGCP